MPRPKSNLTPEQKKEKRREICRLYRERHPNRVRGSNKKYYENHKEQKAEYAKEYYKENKEEYSKKKSEYEQIPEVKSRRKKQKAIYYIDNKDHINKRNKKYQLANAEHLKECAKEYKKNNPEVVVKAFEKYNKTDKAKARFIRYQKNHPGKVRAKVAKRRAAKLSRTVHWADSKAIEKFYENKPEGYEVDHIVPLQGKNISGLHVLSNLQYLSESENSHKGSNFDFNEYKETEHFKTWFKNVQEVAIRMQAK